MRTRRLLPILIVLCAPAALALNNRSAVSVNGLDTNPCTPASPCRSFGYAITQTNPKGEIIALDSAGYGPFTIDKAMTVSGAPGIHAAITVTTGTGITVAAGGSDNVSIRNLVLIGAGGAYGIFETSALDVTVADCLVRGFTASGIAIDDLDTRSVVQHCTVLDNAGAYGIYADGGSAAPTMLVVRGCLVQGNGTGVLIGYNMNAAVVDSVLTGNTIAGLYGYNINALQNYSRVILENCTVAYNNTGIYAVATTTAFNFVIIDMSQSVVAYNNTGAATLASGGAFATLYSFGNNRFVGNGTDGGPFTAVAFQ